MKSGDASQFITEAQQEEMHSHSSFHAEPQLIQIEPNDDLQAVFQTLSLSAQPVILILPEQSQAFSDPAHFALLRQTCDPDSISLVIPKSRMGSLARYAYGQGFSFFSSLAKAVQSLQGRTVERPSSSEALAGPESDPADQEDGEPEQIQPITSSPLRTHRALPPKMALLSPVLSPFATRPFTDTQRRRLIVALVALLSIAGAVLLPTLFSGPSELRLVPVAVPVGHIAFQSSGQLDPLSAQGVNDIVMMTLSHLTPPAHGKSYDAWLLPDRTEKTTRPLLLGTLSVTGGKAQLTYIQPDHTDLLAIYSGFQVTEQDRAPAPPTPSLDPTTWRYGGRIPDTPTPGDEQHYSLLDHVRHLLAKDPTLAQIGLDGGLATWLDRNTEKILEWSSAARDSWANGQTDLIHRQMIRVLDYLEGAAYVSTTGDLPADSPLLVDPLQGRIGLLQVSQTQEIPAYLIHIAIHLQGVANAPGHTEAQQHLALTIETVLQQMTPMLQRVRQDAARLVKMDTAQLKSNDALQLLNDMVSNANTVYVGRPDPVTGATTNGVTWIHSQIQHLAVIPVFALPSEQR